MAREYPTLTSIKAAYKKIGLEADQFNYRPCYGAQCVCVLGALGLASRSKKHPVDYCTAKWGEDFTLGLESGFCDFIYLAKDEANDKKLWDKGYKLGQRCRRALLGKED